MRKGDVIRHALNIVELMDAVSDALMSSFKQTMGDPLVQPRPLLIFEVDEEPTYTANLADIGLDDMGIHRIVIELSTDRSHFKIWTPYSEEFVASIKRQIPKHARSWDKDERCWRVDTYWFGNAQKLLPTYFSDMERYYTNRAMEMCESLARDYEKEEFDKDGPEGGVEDKDPPKKKSKKKPPPTKAKERKGKQVDDEPAPKKKRNNDHGHKGSPLDEYYNVLGVSPDAPDEVVKAAHKALARMYHSDLGGDPKKMARVNTAFEAIKETRGWTAR
jgi:hypothetical protein